MSFCCSQCSFTSQFESALIMHRQLHHPSNLDCPDAETKALPEKNNTILSGTPDENSTVKEKNGLQLTPRTSTTRFFNRLRARIARGRSRILFSHPEETDVLDNMSVPSKCVSKVSNLKCAVAKTLEAPLLNPGSPDKEIFGCHLCLFDADRITVLDRHLLNHHKIGLDNLLQLVMSKTKDGLSEEYLPTTYNVRQTYYKSSEKTSVEGEFIIESITPKIKILKHAATNTDLQWTDIPDLKDNCRMITKELEKLMMCPLEISDRDLFVRKMQTFNQCMCKFVDSSNTLKKVLDSKISVREDKEPLYELGLGDQDSPRNWDRAFSDNMKRNKIKCKDNRIVISKKSDSFYF